MFVPRYWFCLLLSLNALICAAQPFANDSLLAIIRENRQDAAEAKALNAVASNLSRSDIPRAIGYLHQNLALCTRIKDTAYITRSYNQLVTCHLHSGRRDSAAYYLSLLKRMTEETGSVDARTDYHAAAGLFYKIEGNYKEAMPFLLASLQDAQGLVKNDPSVSTRTYLAGQYLNIGNTYTIMADYRKALSYHLQSLQRFEEVGNKQGIAYCYQGIGGDFLSLGQFGEAAAYTQKAIALKVEIKDQRGMGTSLKQLGSIFRGEKQWDSTLNYYFQALKVFQGMSLKIEETDMEFDIGNVYGDKADLPNARIFLNSSMTVAREMGDSTRYKTAEAALLSLQGRVDRERRDEVKLMSSLQASMESGDREMQVSNYQYLADHYAGIKQFDKALYYARKYYEMSDSLQGREVQLQMKRLEAQYNVEKKEREIRLLKEDQQVTKLLLQRQKAFQYGAVVVVVLLLLIGFLVFNRNRAVQEARRLIEMERMRNTIARDLHDDIGSTLTSINVLSTVALEPQEDGFLQSSMQKIKHRSSAIMEKMDDIVWAINPQNDTMEELLTRMKEFATELLEPMNIEYQFEEKGDLAAMKLDVRRRKELYLLFKEAINNAAKYSGCRTLTIRLEQRQGSLRMEISDDGSGFDVEQVRCGNGLSNMRERAASLSGKLLIDPVIGRGTRIVLEAALP
jgi:two-component system sensor histidine kinase UhpB